MLHYIAIWAKTAHHKKRAEQIRYTKRGGTDLLENLLTITLWSRQTRKKHMRVSGTLCCDVLQNTLATDSNKKASIGQQKATTTYNISMNRLSCRNGNRCGNGSGLFAATNILGVWEPGPERPLLELEVRRVRLAGQQKQQELDSPWRFWRNDEVITTNEGGGEFVTPKRLNELSWYGSGLIWESHATGTREGLPRTVRGMLGLRNQHCTAILWVSPRENSVPMFALHMKGPARWVMQNLFFSRLLKRSLLHCYNKALDLYIVDDSRI